MSKAKQALFFALLVATFVLGLGHATSVQAADITWGGSYRVEGIKLENPELSSAESNKSYLLHHLTLLPKMVVSDGITVYSRLDILNNSAFGIDGNGRVFSVAGDVFGNGASSTNAFGNTQRSSAVEITSLYATWSQEFGQLVVGRTPFHFGLGTAFNAGNGTFDHYIDTKDLIAYKVVLGNLFVMPILGKVAEGSIGDEDDVNDYAIQVQYDNPETELSLGFLYHLRIGTFGGNDTAVPGDVGGATGVIADGFKHTLFGVYSFQRIGNFRIGIEADLLSGNTGVATTVGGAQASLDAFGIAGEIAWAPADSRLSGNFKLGLATGDDPGTNDVYEGFIFNRNYDVGLLMFNHPLGQRDFLRTGMVRDTTTTPVRNQIDTEAISNVIYLAPSLSYAWKENMAWGGTLVYGILNKDPIANSGTSTNLGFEVDVNFTYKPYERLTWVTEVGALLPGDAWKGGNQDLENKFGYGIITKAAINF
jgi:hypothetical protein